MDNTTFNSNKVRFIDRGKNFQIEAKQGNQIISLYIPYLGVGDFYGANSDLVRIAYLDADQRLFTSENFRYSPDVRITITAVDNVLKRFDGTFSGTIYDPNNNTPELASDQVLINSGRLVRVNY